MPSTRRQLRRAVIAATIGTTIEWYDFFLYSIVTGLVFAKLFFPNSRPAGRHAAGLRDLCRRLHRAPDRRGDLRPFRRPHRAQVDADRDAADDGHRHLPGRRSCRATRSIGIWGAVILTVLRFVQGIGVGGEWGGSVLLSMEWAQHQRASRLHRLLAAIRRAGRPVPRQPRRAGLQRDLRRPVPRLGLAHPVPAQHRPGRASGSRSGSASSRRRSSAQLVAENRIERAPMLEVIKRQPKEIILSAPSRAWPSRRRSTSSPPLSSPTAPARCTCLARPPAVAVLVGLGGVVLHDPARRASVGPVRPQAHLPDRRGRDRRLRLHLLRDAEHRVPGADLPRASCCRSSRTT